MVPTPAGLVLLPAARAVLAAAERARSVVTDLDGPALRVGVTPGTPASVVPRLWSAIVGRGLQLVPEDRQTAPQLDGLARGELDLGVVVLPIDASGWSTVVVSDVPLGVAIGPAHRLAGERSTVEWSDLAGSELLWFPRDLAPGYHDAILAAGRAAGWVPRAIRQRAARRALFTAELGSGDDAVALRPEADVEPDDGLVWRPLAEPVPRLRHALVWSSQHPRASVLAGLANDVRIEAYTDEHEAPPPGFEAAQGASLRYAPTPT